MISIIIPLYNKEKTIKKTIESILNQSYKDLEIIIVDDGSTDGSLDVIASSVPFCHCEESATKQSHSHRDRHGLPTSLFELRGTSRPRDDNKIKVIKGLGHFGANWARNYGAHLAQGEYLFFCDADIVLRPDALEKMKNALDKNSDASYAYCSFRRGWKKIPSRQFDAEQLKKCNYISTMSLIRRKDFPGFDENLKKFQDWDLWLTMLKQGKRGVFVPEILFHSYVDKEGISKWLPKIFYKIPWLKEVKKYNEAREIIIKKHNL